MYKITQGESTELSLILTSKTTGQPLTGILDTQVRVYVKKKGGVPYQKSPSTLVEVEPVHMPGVYEISVNSLDTDTVGDLILVVSDAGSNNIETSYLIARVEMTVQEEILNPLETYIQNTVLIDTTSIINTQSDILNGVSDLETSLDQAHLKLDSLVSMTERILGLSNENYQITNQTYDPASDQLLSATIKTYRDRAHLEVGTPVLAEYELLAQYDTSGKLINYSVAKKP